MDGDGTLAGYDLAFTRLVADVVDLPVIASGGAGSLEHFYLGVEGGECTQMINSDPRPGPVISGHLFSRSEA